MFAKTSVLALALFISQSLALSIPTTLKPRAPTCKVRNVNSGGGGGGGSTGGGTSIYTKGPSPYAGAVYSCPNTAVTSISFDDGPYIYEQQLVGELVSYNAKASFFVNGNNYQCIYSQASVDALRNAYENGMIIGSHTWSHVDMTTISLEALGVELDRVELALDKILGISPRYMRPPYGSFNDAVVKYLNDVRGYVVMLWNEDSGDSVGATAQQSINTLLANVKQGDIILNHETLQDTVTKVIPNVVPALQSRGINFASLQQCVNNIAPYRSTPKAYGVRDASWTC